MEAPISMEPEEEKKVFISYSSDDLHIVRMIQGRLKEKGIECFVAKEMCYGVPTLGGIVTGLSTSRATLFLVTPKALKSSWFAFETILTLEKSQQRGQLNCVILLHGVTENELPKFALFHMIDKYVLDLDVFGTWNKEQIQKVIGTIREAKTITTELPVGNVAHAQAWSHYFGYHHVIHPYLEEKIKKSTWFRENSKNMPIAVYELVPKNCIVPREIKARNIKKEGTLDPIFVDMGGVVKRPYILNVYSIEEGGEKYYCVAQYPSVLGAIQKMEISPLVDMDEQHKILQAARFYYTLHAILTRPGFEYQSQARLLWFDDAVEDMANVLLEAVKKDVMSTPSDRTATDSRKVLKTLEKRDCQEKAYDAVILHNSADLYSQKIHQNIVNYLENTDVSLHESPLKAGSPQFQSLSEAVSNVRWVILIITEPGIQNNPVFQMETISILEECVSDSRIRIIPVIDAKIYDRSRETCGGISPDIIPDLLRWVTYIDVQTKEYEKSIYEALKGESDPIVLDSAHIPAGNLGYGLAWGYVVNYLKIVLPQLGPGLQRVLESDELNIKVCPDKLYLLVPKTCKCPDQITANHVEHAYSFKSMSDLKGGANIIKSLDIYQVMDDDNIQQEKHCFVGLYPAPFRCLDMMNACKVAGINPQSMEREKNRFCDTLHSLLWGKVGEGLHNKCELVFFDDDDPDDLRRKLLPKIYFDVDREKAQRKRKEDRKRRDGGVPKQPEPTSLRRHTGSPMDLDDLTFDQGEHVFISYSSEDYRVVLKIKDALLKKGISSFVASTSIAAGTPTIDGIVHGINKCKKGLFLVTENALKSSWFAFESILAIERSQQLGKVGAVILLHGVSEDQLPKMAMLDMMPRFNMSIDSDGDWTAEQVQLVVDTLQEEKFIDCELPVGNVAHAQAWSHYFGYHNIVHTHLEQRIKECMWYKENPTNMPIKIYELVPQSCITPCIKDQGLESVGTLAPIVVTRAGNKTRPYSLNVYCIQDGDEKYYCIAQYPNVLSAIRKMEESSFVQMDAQHRELQLSRFFYTLNSILHHSVTTPCHNQSRLLLFDDSTERPKDILLKAIRQDVKRASYETLTREIRLPASATRESEFDVVILYSNAKTQDKERKEEIENYLNMRNLKVHPDVCKTTETNPWQKLEDALEKSRWAMLIITPNSLQDAVMNMKIMALLEASISEKRLRVIPVIDELSAECLPEMLKWVTYINVRTENYHEQIYRALKGEDIPLGLDAAYIPAGNLGYGLAWGYFVNYLQSVLPKFGTYLEQVLKEHAEIVTCPEKLYLLVPSSCVCAGLISDRCPCVDYTISFARIPENLGGANVIKTLDIYSITENDNAGSKKYYFIGQYLTPILCLWEMNNSRLAGVTEESMRKESKRFCYTLNSLLEGPVGDGLQTKCELVPFNDSDPEDIRRQLIPRLQL
ncbi:uncharacterized protein LOC132559766 [Ylistrum balloti]|uniref:uncharacterized protein LOC132559766 n=1 Tax=Ylistrum balloti TaxID=509963 RepID=UPI002905A4AD|nr:uncharacterized protein LOC132559766 [Ylistrum balloti]XP_060080376.1 uncharacterized protein LOC132559766 [Ylistrum balloti]